MTGAQLDDLGGLPVDRDAPVFQAPWEAQAFAMAVHLQEQGLFSKGDWAQALGRSIATAQARGDPDRGDTYFQHWLDALEALVISKGLASHELLEKHREEALSRYRARHEHRHDHD
jgi:nitrile hydratase accessory protein